MFKKSLVFVLIFAFVTGMLAGCGAGGGNAQRPQDELVLAIGGEPDDGFDPTTGWGRYGSPLFQSTLLTRDADLNVVNDLATDYQVSPDGSQWTVTIRPDVVFSDGEPLTSADVVYTFQTAKASGSVVDLEVLAQVEATDATTVVFTLQEPRSTFLYALTSLGIVPQHAHSADYGQHPIGSGPFAFVQWDKGQQLIVEANPEYYGAKVPFTKITFLFLTEEAAFAAAQAGQVDMAAVAASVATAEIPGMKVLAVPSVDNRGIMFPYVPAGEKTDKGYPIGNDVTADPAIRRAINIAVNRQELVDGVLNGFGSKAFSVSDQLPWWNSATQIQDNDGEGAAKILADGGWVDEDGDGILAKDGLRAEFTLVYPAGDSIRQSLAIAVADSLLSLGIKINAEGKSWDEIEKVMHSEAVLFGWGSHDPMEMYNLYSSKYRGVDWFNTGYYANPTVDKYMEEALAEADEAKANALWQKAQWDGSTGFSLLGDAPWAWLVNIDHVYYVREDLELGQLKIHPHGHGWPITDNIATWTWVK